MFINRWMGKENVVMVCVCMCIYTIEYYSAIKKKENFAICSNMGGRRGHYTKQNKSEKD